MDVDTLILAAGAIMFTGFISKYLFRRFKAPDVHIMPRRQVAVLMVYIPLAYYELFSSETATVTLCVTVVVMLLSTAMDSIGAFYMEMHTERCERAESNGGML